MMEFKLNARYARLWLRYVVAMREYYEGKNDDFEYICPFCELADDIFTRHCMNKFGLTKDDCIGFDKCDFCLWKLFEGECCPDIIAINGRQLRKPTWCASSIKRLKRWEARLKEIIKKEEWGIK